MSKKLRWGIVSTGRIAQEFCQDMRFVENGELAAVAARKLEDAKAFANKHGIEKAYQGYQSLFDDAGIDVIYVATPHNFHFQNARDALMAGKSVLCEKPITISSEECQQLSELAQSKGLFLMEAMWTYFLPAIKKAKQWFDEGRIGTLKHIKADFGYLMPFDSESRLYNADLAGGCLLDMGIYPIALSKYFNDYPLENLMVKSHIASTGVEDDIVILADSGDIKLTLASSFTCKLPNIAYIIGDAGYIAIPNFWHANQCSLFVKDEQIDHFDDHRSSLGFNYEAQAVGEAIQQQQLEHPLMPHKTSFELQQQMEAIFATFKSFD
ncbi:Gfo/Idh/MocA family oxidoreductase [Colwellia sp. 1_MG-2023]|uniref:Gfo/Idh/MocA family protein n=1 Tax=Colwellia sp. 1_MG-2023 TaxID=3062649 RepID=UPI0026E2B2D6|nr:Gfo/Idh/MocA family oxidoreductase [Colwellia sp. 1_MG-2023]MDO6447565.1 Gfo/Idh/MocA family oxidoreductase [Colwellia sp. 1_MG-2023]